MIWKTIAAFFTILFLFAAAVQYNDPDAAIWILAYLYPAGLALAALLRRLWFWPSLAGTLIYIVAGGLVFPGFVSDWFSSEEFREAGGLWICAIWTAILTVRAARLGRLAD